MDIMVKMVCFQIIQNLRNVKSSLATGAIILNQFRKIVLDENHYRVFFSRKAHSRILNMLYYFEELSLRQNQNR